MCYLECLFSPYDHQAAEIAEKVFSVVKINRSQREGQTLKDRQTVLLDETSSVYPRGASPIIIGASILFCFFFVSLYWDRKWKNLKLQTRLPVLCFLPETSVSWTHIQYSSRCKNLQFFFNFSGRFLVNIFNIFSETAFNVGVINYLLQLFCNSVHSFLY